MKFFRLIFLLNKLLHSFFIFFLKVFGDLFDHGGKRIFFKFKVVLFCILIVLFRRIHGLNELKHRIRSVFLSIDPSGFNNVK